MPALGWARRPSHLGHLDKHTGFSGYTIWGVWDIHQVVAIVRSYEGHLDMYSGFSGSTRWGVWDIHQVVAIVLRLESLDKSCFAQLTATLISVTQCQLLDVMCTMLLHKLMQYHA